MDFQHRHGHNYYKDPRAVVKLQPGLLAKEEEKTLSDIQETYLELLHDRLIEDITDGIALDTPIYRIDTLEHFKEALQKRELYLANPCKWEDPWESFMLRGKAFLQDGTRIDISAMKDSYFAQCWSLIPESEGIWKSRCIGAWDSSGKRNENKDRNRFVKIKTTVRILMREVYKIDDLCGHAKFCIGAVRYRTARDIDIMHESSFKDPSLSSQERDIINSLLTKRIGYEYEGEVRLICHENFEGKISDGNIRDHIVLSNVDPRRFASEIEIDPWCPYDEFNRIKTELENEYKIYCIEKSPLLVDSITPTIMFGKDCLVVTPTRIIAPQL